MNWQPSASIDALRQRAQILANIRVFFNDRGYLEVETPILARYGITDVYLSNIQAFFRDKTYYLQTSPEYHMKRLLAAGSGPIFQLAKVFRDDELGRWHNPEFTMLEWYQLGLDHHGLMDEMDLLLQQVINSPPMIRQTYQQVFIEMCDLDPIVSSVADLQDALVRFNLLNVLPGNEQDRDQYLFLLMSEVIEPALAEQYQAPIAIYGYPISQAALAKVSNGVADRFEVYYRGIELANGFHELTDPSLQLARFTEDNCIRQKKDQAVVEIDTYLLRALEHGLPACSGVALGIDRLVAIALGASSLADCLAFDFSRA